MNDKPLVSIIIPTFNRAEIIRQALDGAIEQTYENVEIIVSDNCSSDNTEETVAGYIRKDARVKYYRNEKNLGSHGNHHQAFRYYANGDWAIFVSDDDYLSDKDFVSKGMQHIMQQNDEVAFYQSGFITFYEKTNEKIEARPNAEAALEVMSGVKYFRNYFERSFFSFTTTLFNRKAVLENKLNVDYFTTDLELILALALQKDRICIFSNDIGGVYRVHANQNYGGADFKNYVKLYGSYKTTSSLAKSGKYLSLEEYRSWKAKAENRFRKDIVNLLYNQYKAGLNGFNVIKSSILFRVVSYINRIFKNNFVFLADEGKWIFNSKGIRQELHWIKFKNN